MIRRNFWQSLLKKLYRGFRATLKFSKLENAKNGTRKNNGEARRGKARECLLPNLINKRPTTGACNRTADFRGLVVFRVKDMTLATPTVRDICSSTEANWKRKT